MRPKQQKIYNNTWHEKHSPDLGTQTWHGAHKHMKYSIKHLENIDLSMWTCENIDLAI